ncbi:MAG: SURF1 family protein [Pseudomonadota bacterium]
MTRVITPLIFGLAGVAILVSLGVWQMQRLTWKEAILADIEARISAAPVSVPANAQEGRDTYLPIFESGEIGAGEIHVLVSQKRIGAGYRIIAPFTLADGRTVLLDRGFTKTENKATERAKGPADVTGNLHWPDEKGSAIPEPDMAANIWFARDVPAMAAALGTEPTLIIARDVTPADPQMTPLPVDTSGIPNDHLQYAVTWFSLAVIWAIMTLYFLWRARPVTRRTEGPNA